MSFKPTRRTLLAGALAAPFAARAASLPAVTLGILPFGSVQWIASVISHHGLDEAHGFALRTRTMASTEAAKVALLGHAVDISLSDWPFVATQRRHGGTLCFAAGASGSLGGIMVPAHSGITRLADLAGKRLGVAGGAADKSWLLVQAAARAGKIDLSRAASLSFGAPPLLSALLQQGALDAVLTFWNFAARLDAAGYTEAISVTDCARALGLINPPVLVGYVFDAGWALTHRGAIGGFLAASAAAADMLATSPAEWARIRPLMNAPDDALFAALQRRFIAGIHPADPTALRAQAAHIEALIAPRAASLPPGVFWQGEHAG